MVFGLTAQPNTLSPPWRSICSYRNCTYVIEFDIKGFFDNVNHSKLIRQIWALGIHDKQLLFVLRRILSAPIRLENGQMAWPTKGTPQGGIISPLLANIVLNELDHWIESQWVDNPAVNHYRPYVCKSGSVNRGNGIRMVRETTRLKEMYIVRYADDFRIFCRTKTDAEKTKIAVTQWLSERLKLEVSEEKTKVVNVSRHYSDFLGFKIKVVPKGGKQVIRSHVADKNLAHKSMKLTEQAKRIKSPRPQYGEARENQLYKQHGRGYAQLLQVGDSCFAGLQPNQSGCHDHTYEQVKESERKQACQDWQEVDEPRKGKIRQIGLPTIRSWFG